MSAEAGTKPKVRTALEKVGKEAESIVRGQQGTQRVDAGQAAWRTGDMSVGKFEHIYSVWVGGTGEHVDKEWWEAA